MFSWLMSFLFPPHCPRCTAYVPEAGDWCAECLAAEQALHRLPAEALYEAWAVSRYTPAMQGLIKGLKYHGRKSLLPWFTSFLRAAPYELPALYDFAVPVPLYKKKERARGFNQTELIFRGYLGERGLPLVRALCRTRATEPLYRLGPKERERVLRGAFSLAPGKDVRGRRILLLDDIYTTGATARECRRVLLKHGAAAVDVLVFASDAGT